MRAILIPVKEFHRAKVRLAPHFSSLERASLAKAMCHDFFAVIAQLQCVDRVFVVSKEKHALSRALELGWEVISESNQVSESDSVDFASRICVQRGVQALLRVPIDIPLAEPRDIEALFNHLPQPPSAVLVPSRDGTGTNALLRTPPELFPLAIRTRQFGKAFGGGKSAPHSSLCRPKFPAGVRCR